MYIRAKYLGAVRPTGYMHMHMCEIDQGPGKLKVIGFESVHAARSKVAQKRPITIIIILEIKKLHRISRKKGG